MANNKLILPECNFTENRYANRAVLRNSINEISHSYFKKTRAGGWSPSIKADIHIADRLTDREFPLDEFIKIVVKLATKNETEIMDIVNNHVNGINDKPIRINCYGHGAWMIGITIKVFPNNRAFHINIRTCYAERNMQHRQRNVDVHKIWTRGIPYWMKNIEK